MFIQLMITLLSSRLRENPRSQLQASFAMMPSSSTPVDPSLDFHTFRSSRNATNFSSDPSNPLAPLLPGPINPKDLLKRFLGNAAVVQPLLLRSTSGTSGDSVGEAERSEVGLKGKERVHIMTRSLVTMAKDFAVYDFKGFNASLVGRTQFRVRSTRAVDVPPHSLNMLSSAGHSLPERRLPQSRLRALVLQRRPFREPRRVRRLGWRRSCERQEAGVAVRSLLDHQVCDDGTEGSRPVEGRRGRWCVRSCTRSQLYR